MGLGSFSKLGSSPFCSPSLNLFNYFLCTGFCIRFLLGKKSLYYKSLETVACLSVFLVDLNQFDVLHSHYCRNPVKKIWFFTPESWSVIAIYTNTICSFAFLLLSLWLIGITEHLLYVINTQNFGPVLDTIKSLNHRHFYLNF